MNLHGAVGRSILVAAIAALSAATFVTSSIAGNAESDASLAIDFDCLRLDHCSPSGTPGDPFVHDQLPLYLVWVAECFESAAEGRMSLVGMIGGWGPVYGTPGDIDPHVSSSPGDGFVHEGIPAGTADTDVTTPVETRLPAHGWTISVNPRTHEILPSLADERVSPAHVRGREKGAGTRQFGMMRAAGVQRQLLGTPGSIDPRIANTLPELTVDTDEATSGEDRLPVHAWTISVNPIAHALLGTPGSADPENTAPGFQVQDQQPQVAIETSEATPGETRVPARGRAVSVSPAPTLLPSSENSTSPVIALCGTRESRQQMKDGRRKAETVTLARCN